MIDICKRCKREDRIYAKKLCTSCYMGLYKKNTGYSKRPEVKEKNRKFASEWYKKNKEKHIETVKNNYKKYKNKHNSRTSTSYVINKFPIKKECKKCHTNINLQIHHKIYPSIITEIKKAILDNKIYYLCKKCHIDIHTI